jgi:hypothetical protein
VIIWSDHALDRLEERARTDFARAVHGALRARDWAIYYEIDPREGRGLRTNYVVPREGAHRAVVRLTPRGDYIVVSVLSAQQAEFNATTIWGSTPEQAQLRGNRERGTSPLTHNPFRSLKR